MGSLLRAWLAGGLLVGLPCCSGGNISGTGGTTGGDAASPGATATDPNFSANTTAEALNKVKTLLVGAAADANELASVTADANALRTLVRSWMQTDAFQTTLLHFFADAFQQSLTQPQYFPFNIWDFSAAPPNDNLMQNFRESFGRTVVAMVNAKTPFNQTASTNTFMMTTAMLEELAYMDVSIGDDSRVLTNVSNTWIQVNANSNFLMIDGTQATDLTAAATPASPLYRTFYVPGLSAALAGITDATTRQRCQSSLPQFRLGAGQSFAGARVLPSHLRAWLTESIIQYWYPDQYAGVPISFCSVVTQPAPAYLTPADYNDWRMVEIRAPQSNEIASTFYDLPTLRKASTTQPLLLQTPYVGYFTTPAFLSQWSTNTSNQARVTLNQTLITGLGDQVDGTDTLALTNPTAVDSAHAADPACFACHQTLDPMRQFFRQSYSLTWSLQQNQTVKNIPATFAFRGVTGNGNGVGDLGRYIANHPNFATAWTVKLCSWANSSTCLSTDPEVIRIAKNFSDNNFDFQTLVLDLFTSPLVTYSASTASTTAHGQVASMARRHQYCAILTQRLGAKSDLCDQQGLHVQGATDVPSAALMLPSDGYARGASAPLYITQPDLFLRSNFEQICGLLSNTYVGTRGTNLSTADVPGAVSFLVHQLMGVAAADDAEATAILTQHYNDAVAAGISSTVALRSTFVAACTSPSVVSVGQ